MTFATCDVKPTMIHLKADQRSDAVVSLAELDIIRRSTNKLIYCLNSFSENISLYHQRNSSAATVAPTSSAHKYCREKINSPEHN